jgi:hypothetical protein
VASLAWSRDSAEAFAPIRDRWADAMKPGAREKLVPDLERFVARFPGDGLTPLARTYLAIALEDAGRLDDAEKIVDSLATLPPGATRDLLEIAHARLLRARKLPVLAFDHVRPLVGKVVDPTARAMLQEEVSLAAIESQRDYEAIAYMDAWLRSAGEEERDAVRAKVAKALESLPERVLEDALRAMRTGGAASGYGREIERLVADRLGAIAIARGDSDLARWLVNGEAAGATISPAEAALGELATTHAGLASVDGRTIGLVLPTGSTDLRDEAAAVMRGAALALDLPRANPGGGDLTKLVTRDDAGDESRIEPAMSELAGEGAVVILAALDPVGADHAVRWGEEHGVAVVAMAATQSVAPREWAFVAGVPRASEIAVLGEELVSRAAAKIVPVVPPGGSPAIASLARGTVELEPPVPCDTAAAQSGEAHFPIEVWKALRIRAWLVDAPSECARDLIRELGGESAAGIVGLTLDAAGTTARAPSLRLLAVRAGAIPVTAAAPAGVEDPEVRAYFAREGAPPNAWTALGHDAAILARRAVAALPLDATSDFTEVKKRRALVQASLAAANAHLWTTASTGFAGTHVLPRELGVVELATPTASH